MKINEILTEDNEYGFKEYPDWYPFRSQEELDDHMTMRRETYGAENEKRNREAQVSQLAHLRREQNKKLPDHIMVRTFHQDGVKLETGTLLRLGDKGRYIVKSGPLRGMLRSGYVIPPECVAPYDARSRL